MIFAGDTSQLQGEPSTRICKFRWENLAGLESIRVLTVDLLDMFPAGSRRSIIEREFAGENHEQFLQRFTSSIPRTVETLIFQDTPAQRLADYEMRAVGDALMHLIEEKQPPICRNIAAIYVDNFEDRMREARCKWAQHTEGGWLREVQLYGEVHGVAVYTQDDLGATDRFIEHICSRVMEV
ncbi:hypothetical protein LTR37_007316 [Vermiconidia calcicola]|uniref:Uncharacterized protein n=1 Tax=Vermiconidia calcicola TaxID=1690605 RepID=A0ACC3NDL7_9PEZI|nr:hypothetical protein LTR37_007316 [Vermiconidia calcicola]